MDDDLLSTGDFSKPVFNNDEYVDEIKLDAKRRIAEKEKFMDDGKKGMKPSSPMKKGTFEMNKNFNSLHTGDLYQVPGKAMSVAKVKSKELWVDEPKHGMKYASPAKKSSTPGDSYSTISGKLPAAFPPMGNYPPRGVRTKVDVADIKDFRNVQTSPLKKGLGGCIASKGVLLSPFPAHQVDGITDDYDALDKKMKADAAAHKAAQTAVDERARYVSTTKGTALFDSQRFCDAPTVLSHDSQCIVRDPTPLEAADPKTRVGLINDTMPWRKDASKQWKDASPQQSWKHASITAPPEYMPEPYNDHAIRECQMPLRRMGWHRHVAAGVVSESVIERKPFRPSQGVRHTKLSTSIAFRGMRA